MRYAILLIALTVMFLIAGPLAQASPPVRPLPLTQAQFDQLCQIETQAEHVAVLDIRASYTSEREAQLEKNRLVDDATTAAYQFGWPLAILLIALGGL